MEQGGTLNKKKLAGKRFLLWRVCAIRKGLANKQKMAWKRCEFPPRFEDSRLGMKFQTQFKTVSTSLHCVHLGIV
jgi:hypothetical protein